MRLKEEICAMIAWLLPKEIVKWCFYRMTVYATTGKYGNTEIPGLSWETIAKRWEGK